MADTYSRDLSRFLDQYVDHDQGSKSGPNLNYINYLFESRFPT